MGMKLKKAVAVMLTVPSMVTYTNILTFSRFNSEHKGYKGDLT